MADTRTCEVTATPALQNDPRKEILEIEATLVRVIFCIK